MHFANILFNVYYSDIEWIRFVFLQFLFCHNQVWAYDKLCRKLAIGKGDKLTN